MPGPLERVPFVTYCNMLTNLSLSHTSLPLFTACVNRQVGVLDAASKVSEGVRVQSGYDRPSVLPIRLRRVLYGRERQLRVFSAADASAGLVH